MPYALIAIAAIFVTFAICACVLAARADEAIENFLNENPNGDRLPLSCRRQVPGGSSSRTAAGDTLINSEGD